MFEEPQMLKKDGVLTPSGTHCFLGIVKHEEGQAPEILEELHFRRPAEAIQHACSPSFTAKAATTSKILS